MDGKKVFVCLCVWERKRQKDKNGGAKRRDLHTVGTSKEKTISKV